jgi:CHASE3 domain sensor protein
MTLSLRGVAWAAFGLAVVLLVGSSIFLLRATHALFDSETLVAHTREVQAVIGDLSSKLFQVTNSRRGYILTGDDAFLGESRAVAAIVPQDLDRLRQLTADQGDRQQELGRLQGDIAAQLAIVNNSLEANRTQ